MADQNTGCGCGDHAPSCGDDRWQDTLTPEQYRILRQHGTERPGTSPLNDEKRPGLYACAGCGQVLFDAATKYDSGSGWPSFFQPREGAVATTTDTSHGMVRTEVHCSQCNGHLGHVFPDGPRPTGLRYCMNGLALSFQPASG
ncbi:Peptide methionine sulfoxide reductase msrB [Granulibacter bethesdensis]|uniref:peptide-methionine (R)-S-oxide reductase MsrB n=1 Tax=Granulibacter bethesdensis TaxID=364410 RepID=UPI000909E80B|nr:peptide-methionine (R)-S-oxide reductase MsrB [Granulibacter bethesdensis]APH57990.1 Peptide methionine sulfoxide reductase msrB [Granulibacter bethesdensis]